MKTINTLTTAGATYLSRGRKNHAVLEQGNEIGLCPTGGHCLNRKWVIQNRGPWVISVGMWKPTGIEGEYEVESVDVCASKECRLPVDASTKIKIDNWLGNLKMTPREHLDSLDYLLEGL